MNIFTSDKTKAICGKEANASILASRIYKTRAEEANKRNKTSNSLRVLSHIVFIVSEIKTFCNS